LHGLQVGYFFTSCQGIITARRATPDPELLAVPGAGGKLARVFRSSMPFITDLPGPWVTEGRKRDQTGLPIKGATWGGRLPQGGIPAVDRKQAKSFWMKKE
jgi:hypothetical protein